MATIYELSEEEQKNWDEWLAVRPPLIQDLATRFPPNKLFRLKTSGHRVTLYSYAENGTMTVLVLGKYNSVDFERGVFGIVPENLEECDLPSPDEPLGAMLTRDEDIKAYLAACRDDADSHQTDEGCACAICGASAGSGEEKH